MIVSSFVKKQLVVFTIGAIVAATALGIVFMRIPESLSIGRYEVRAEFDTGAGLYEGSQVNYRGVPVGKVSSMKLTENAIEVELSLKTGVHIPADVGAEIHSMSAVGEQYVELVPGSSVGTLHEGDVIPLDRTREAVEIGPVLDNVQALVDSLPSRKLDVLIAEANGSFAGRDSDLQSILDDSQSLIEAADANFSPTEQLIRQSGPLLSTVNRRAGNIRAFSSNIAQVTDELRAGDADLQALLRNGPGFANETSDFLTDVEPILPDVLQSLDAVSSVLARYRASLAQLLGDYPKAVAAVQSVTIPELGAHDVRLTLANEDKPAECLQGFLPVSQWASPYDLSTRKTPLVYCRLPAGDPRGVRGVRNVPCPDNPARRAATPAECRD